MQDTLLQILLILLHGKSIQSLKIGKKYRDKIKLKIKKPSKIMIQNEIKKQIKMIYHLRI